MPRRSVTDVWADLLYAPAPPIPDDLRDHVDVSSPDPLRWKLTTRDSVHLVRGFLAWRRAFIHTVHVGPLPDMVTITAALREAGHDYPLDRSRSLDQATSTAAWVVAADVIASGTRLRVSVDRFGAAAAVSRALGVSLQLRHSRQSWPQTAAPAPDPLSFVVTSGLN